MICLLAVVAMSGLQTPPESQAIPYPASSQYAPTPIPDRIILSWTEDPYSSMTVNWRTDTSVEQARVEYALSTHGPQFLQETHSMMAEPAEPLTGDLGEAHYHSVTMRGLEEGKQYVYRVGDGVNWSEWIQFSTPYRDNSAFSFVYFGDSQNDVRSMWSRVIRQAFSDAPKAAFMLHAGDLVNRPTSDKEWGEWFGAGGWVASMVPHVCVPGNHEYAQGKVAPHWRPAFSFPTNGLPGLEETNYTLVYKNLRIVALNSNERLQEQAAWLGDVLTKNTSRWVIVTFHHPVFSTARGRDNTELRSLWKPIFDKHRVDLVLQGHDHAYGRMNLDTGLEARDAAVGTVYVVSVSGPKMYDVEKEPYMKKTAQNTQLYQIITVRNDRIIYEARDATGEPFDAFDLVKREGQPNLIVEKS